MLKHWTTHSEYIDFVSDSVSRFNPSQLKRWHSFADSFEKLSSMNLDPLAKLWLLTIPIPVVQLSIKLNYFVHSFL